MARAFTIAGTTEINCPDRAGFDTTSGTVACWFKTPYAGNFNGTGGGNMLRRDGATRHFLLRMVPTTFKVQGLAIFGGNPSVTSASALNDDAWHHVTFKWTFDDPNSTIQLFIDGTSEGTGSPTGSMPSGAEEVYIGSHGYANTEHFEGNIAEASYWNAALSQAEVTLLARGFSPAFVRPASLVMHIPMTREVVDRRGAAPTLVGTTVSNHPRMIYPRRRQMNHTLAGAPPATGSPWYYNANQVVAS